jgi:DNA-binding Lrp family transcriptional regulator
MSKSKIDQQKLDYIRQYAGKLPDVEIAKNLTISVPTVRKYREQMGIFDKRSAHVKQGAVAANAAMIGKKLSDKQKEEYFKSQLLTSLDYKILKKQFTEEEIDFFIEAWAAYCVQF